MLQAKPGRSDKQEQEQNSSNLGTAFPPSPKKCIFTGDEERVEVRDHAKRSRNQEKEFPATNRSPDFHLSEWRESLYRCGGSHFPSRNYHAKRPRRQLKLMAFLDGGPPILRLLKGGVLGDKMNLTVRLGKLFYGSSTDLPALLPCSQLPRQARGILRK